MKFLFRFLFLIGVFSCLHIGNVQSQGILIFEISDSRNKAVTNLEITTYKEGGEVYKTYTTDENGRVVDPTFPTGTYTYSFDYGDYNKDTFQMSNGGYTWIDLDYRILQISFKDDEGTPLTDKRATIHKVYTDKPNKLISEKYSDEEGTLQFLLPKGDYIFSTFKGEVSVHLEDENINEEVEVSSGQITHSFNFRFVKNGKETAIYTKEFEVTHLAGDSIYHYGSADVAPAPGSRSVNGFYETSRSSTPVSLCAGTFVVSVETKDYGRLSDTITLDDNFPLTGNMHDFIIKDIPGSQNPDDGGSEGGGDGGKDDDEEEDDEDEAFNLTIHTIDVKDSVTHLADIPVVVRLVANNKTVGSLSNADGLAFYKAKGVVDIYALADTIKNFNVTQDTVVYVYVDPTKGKKVLFDFFYGKEQFEPKSIKEILVWDSYNSDIYFRYPSTRKGDDEYTIVDAITLPEGRYTYSFYLTEKNYEQRINRSLTIAGLDTTIHATTKLTPYHNLTIELKDINGENFESRQFIHQLVGISSIELLTDSLGKYHNSLLEGVYTYEAMGDTQTFSLTSDTIIYFQYKAPHTQRVFFQFLHDGRLVYPQIMNMDIHKSDSTKYARIVSKHVKDYKGFEDAWIFDQPAICEDGKYYVTYELKDYDFKGVHARLFEIPNTGSSNDTTIYIVVPVKRTVTISVKDANLELLQGVNANIYKYDSNGKLMQETYYDDLSHEMIRTNTDGQVIDLLSPGRYQLRIIDIARDFIVKDYDLNFEVVSGAKMYDVKYIALYKESNEPASNLLLDIQKNGTFYNSSYTDSTGTVEIFCEKGKYSYNLHYGSDHYGSYDLKADTTIYLYLENPVYIDSMEITNCACVSNGDTLDLSLYIHPENATMKEVEWEVDNQALAQITSDNKLIINNIDLEGFFTLTVKATDKGQATASKRIHVGKDCGTTFTLHFDGTESRDMPIKSNTVNLKITPDTRDAFNYMFLYQISTDSIQWSNVSEPTTDTLVSVSTSDITKLAYFRALISDTKGDLLAYAKAGAPLCGTDKTTQAILLRRNELTPTNWTDSICSNHGALTYTIDKTKLGKISEGYQIEWATKRNENDAYTTLEGMSGKDTLHITFDTTTFIRIAIQKDEEIMVSYEQKVFVEQLPSIHLTVSRDTVCLGDTIQLSTIVENGQIRSYTWSANDSKESSIMVLATDTAYVVNAQSFYGLCPTQSDTLSIALDRPIDIDVLADQKIICETQAEGTILRVDRLGNQISQFIWSDQSTADTLHITPATTTTYKVQAASLYDRCPRVEDSTTVEVRNALSVQLFVDEYDICQTGADSITLSAKVLSGDHYRYIWWDSLVTDTAERKVFLDKSASPWVMIRDSVCADSEKDSINVHVAHPAEASIKTTTKVFEYGSAIDLVAETTESVTGPYSWYSVDAEGDERILSTTDESYYSDMPNGDVSYYVTIENGACPIIASGKISAVLADNIVIPTIFTPYTVDGFNDDFMPGYKVVIYDRYGNIVCNSNDGWDGNYRGETAEPGVYMYVITLKDGRVVKGTIEVFRK